MNSGPELGMGQGSEAKTMTDSAGDLADFVADYLELRVAGLGCRSGCFGRG